jgi:hypothetical protein
MRFMLLGMFVDRSHILAIRSPCVGDIFHESTIPVPLSDTGPGDTAGDNEGGDTGPARQEPCKDEGTAQKVDTISATRPDSIGPNTGNTTGLTRHRLLPTIVSVFPWSS